jgi:MGT family glycosyltransferase
MARFLLTVWPISTHLNPFLAVGRSLRARGHEVTFYTGGTGRDEVQAEGFPCFGFEGVDTARVECALNRLVSISWRPSSWRDFMLGTVPEQLRDLDKILELWPPDAIVCDVAMWGPILVLHEVKAIPVAVLSHVAVCLLPGPDNPFPGLSWLLQERLVRPAAPLIAKLLQMASGSVPRLANRLRQSYKLPPFTGTVTEFTGKLPLYLVPGTPAFDGERRDLPPSAKYVGPCLPGERQGCAPPDWISQIARDRPCIVVIEGSIYPEKPLLLQTAARALARAPFNVILVAGQGRDLHSLELGSLAENVRLESWTPLSDLLRLASVIVAYGDSETVMGALHRHVPMVLMPTILDQPIAAWRVACAGAGLVLPRWRRSPARLRAAVMRVLSDTSFQKQASRLAGDFVEFSGGERAARLLEGLTMTSATPARLA